MRTDNATFAAANLAASKDPRFVAALSFDTANSDILYLTSHSDADTPSTTQVIPDCIASVSGVGQRVIPEKAESSIGELSFSAIDAFDANSPRRDLTTYINENLTGGDGIRNKRLQLYVGYDGMAWADYELRYTYVVDDVNYSDGLYTFRCSDPQRFIRKEIFVPDTTTLSASITATQTHIPCNLSSATTRFFLMQHDAGYSDAPSTLCSYIKINDEIVRVGSEDGSPILGNGSTAIYTHPTDGLSFHVLERGALNTTARAHDTVSGGDPDRQPTIKEYIFLEGPAPKLAYALLTGILAGDQAQSPQLELPAHWHAGVGTAFVRLSDFTGIGADLWDTSAPSNGRRLRFTGLEKTDAKQFIEREVLRWLGAYLPVYSNGELGLRQLEPVLSDAGYVAVLDNTNITRYSELNHDLQAVINAILLQWNYNETKKEYTRSNLIIDSDSQTTHQEAQRQTYSFRGVTTGGSTDRDLRIFTNTVRDRYANPPQRLTLNVLPSLNVLEVGDTVLVQTANIQDYVGGSDIDRVFEIQQITTDWMTGELVLELFASSGQPSAISTESAAVVADDFYEQGTLLSTPLTISGDAVTASGSLSSGDYHWLSDLTVNAGITVTVSGTVRLFIRGSFTLNGDIDGAGNGAAAGTGQTTIADNSTDGTNGYIGMTQAGGGLDITAQYSRDGDFLANPYADEIGKPNVAGLASVAAVPLLALRNRTDESPLLVDGLPSTLVGTGGGGGLACVSHDEMTSPEDVLIVFGGNGGAGGAGLMIMSRGGGIGVAGSIDLSGDDGADAGFQTFPNSNWTWNGGSGAGGFPGACVWLLDGNVSAPDLVDNLTANSGDTPQPASLTYPRLNFPNPMPQGNHASNIRGFLQRSHSQACARVQYIPAAETVEAETDVVHQIATPSAPTLAIDSALPNTPNDTGLMRRPLEISWTQETDPDFRAYEIQARRTSASAWRNIAIIEQVDVVATTFYVLEGERWEGRLRILSINSDGHSDFSSASASTVNYSARGLFKEFQRDIAGATNGYGFSAGIDPSGNFIIAGASFVTPGSANLLGKRGKWEVVNSTITSPGGTTSPTTDVAFGAAVSISNNATRFVVTDPDDTNGGLLTGRFIVYRYEESAAFAVELNSAGLTTLRQYGFVCALNKNDGSRLIVGAPGYNNGGASDGRTYTFQRSGTTWAGVVNFTGGASSTDRMGYAVGISADGDTIAYMAATEAATSPATGRLYISRWDNTLSPEAYANVDTYEPPAAFGTNKKVQGITISDDGSYIAVGDAEANVYILEETATDVWSLQQRIQAASESPENDGRLGGSIAFGPGNSPTRLAIGQPHYNGEFSESGQVLVYQRDDTDTWALLQTIVPKEPITQGRFGSGVAMNHDTLVIGSGAGVEPSVFIYEAVNILE